MLESAQEVEGAQARSTGALATARASMLTAAQQHEAAARQADERVTAAQAEVQSLKQQVLPSATSMSSLRAHAPFYAAANPHALVRNHT